MGIDEYRKQLGEATGHGWGFLAAYGLTWLVCAVVWSRATPRMGAYVTLFQGMVALPLALLLTVATPGPARPSLAGMDGLSVLLACGQLLGLPVVIYLVVRGRLAQVPLAMVILLVVHFAPYSWLYDTPLYLVMGAAVSIAAVLADRSARSARSGTTDSGAPRGDQPHRQDAVGAARTCVATGLVMLCGAGVAAIL